MTNVLNVAEKPSVANTISHILSGGQCSKRRGYSKFNPVFEFPYRIQGELCNMKMTSVLGHLKSLDFSSEFKNWKSVNPAQLFDAEIIKFIKKENEPIKINLERESRSSAMLIIWTDCDREGENIGFEVIEVCSRVSQNLRVYRARFSALTFPDLTRALQNLIRPDSLVSAAVDARSELDLRIGVVFTRYQTLKLQSYIPELSNQVISYGPCQFPTLGFIVDRFKRIEEFVPEKFWKIEVSYAPSSAPSSQNTIFSWVRNRIFDHSVCLVIFEECLENSMAKVISVIKKPKSKWRPLPLTTIELQKTASKKLKITSEETMKIAEDLYRRGLISYPRTETDQFEESIDLEKLVRLQLEDPHWGNFASMLVSPNGFAKPNPRKGKKNDKSHPPIHPTKYTSDLAGKEKSIYEFVTRHFLACLSADAKAHETLVTIEINQELFATKGLSIFEYNYLEVYIYEKWCDKSIPCFEVGQTFQPNSIEMIAGETSSATLLSEAELISLMDKHGIGTDATIAEHISKILERKYTFKVNNLFQPSTLGMGLVEAYDSMGFELAKPRLRAQMEAELTNISNGSRPYSEVVRHFIATYRDIFLSVNAQTRKFIHTTGQYLGYSPSMLSDRQPSSHDQNSFHSSSHPSTNSSTLRSTNSSSHPSTNSSTLRSSYSSSQQRPPNSSNTTESNFQNSSLEFQNFLNSSFNSGENFTSEHQENIPLCLCQLPAIKLSVTKANENQGRKFFRCSKSFAEKCSFFEWADARTDSHAANLPAFSSSGDSSTTDYKCFTCNQSGHFSSNCPKKLPPSKASILSAHPSYSQPQSALNFPSASTSSTVQCFKCNQPGHYANQCNERNSSASSSFAESSNKRRKKSKPASKSGQSSSRKGKYKKFD